MGSIQQTLASLGGAAAFSPTDIPGLTIWLKADAIVGKADGDFLSSWPDSSTNGNDGTQGTAGQQPTYQTNELNGLPIVRFDKGREDLFNTPSIVAATWTTFLVIKSADSAAGCILRTGNTGNSIFQGLSGTDIQFYNTPTTTIGTLSTIAFQVITCNVGASATGSWCIAKAAGDGFAWSGDIAELISYGSALSAPNIALVQGYLGAKYAL